MSEGKRALGTRARAIAAASLMAVLVLPLVALAQADAAQTTHDTVVPPFMADAWRAFLEAPPIVFFGALAIGLVGPVPVSVFYVTAGPLFGIGPALAWLMPTLAVNAVLVHAIGATAVRPRLVRLIERRGLRVPLLEDQTDQLLFATVVRVTPGIPYALQSWAIVLAGIRLAPFVGISVCVQMVYATGFVVLGRSAFEGRLGLAATAIAFLVVAGLVARQAHARLRDRAPELGEADSETRDPAKTDEASNG